MKTTHVAALVVSMLGVMPGAMAQDMTSGLSAGVLDIVDEVRIGGHYHNVYWTMLPQGFNEWWWGQPGDVSFDVLFKSPDSEAFRWIGSPRPEIGATISLTGYEHLFHVGVTWQLPVFETPFYLEGTFGAAAHSGYLTGAPGLYRNLGCPVNFYERFGVGANLSENVTATLTYEHTSNAGLCQANAGLSNVGVRLGWKF